MFVCLHADVDVMFVVQHMYEHAYCFVLPNRGDVIGLISVCCCLFVDCCDVVVLLWCLCCV